MNVLPIIDLFDKPYQSQSERQISVNEQYLQQMRDYRSKKRNGEKCDVPDRSKISPITIPATYITGMEEIVKHLVLQKRDLQAQLNDNSTYQQWISSMPTNTNNLLTYKALKVREKRELLYSQINQEINYILTENQILFHAGILLPSTDPLTLNYPLSTSLCPATALAVAKNNAINNPQLLKHGQIDFLILKVKNPATKVFVYNAPLEPEVLFASGATLKKIKDREEITEEQLYDQKLPLYFHFYEIS